MAANGTYGLTGLACRQPSRFVRLGARLQPQRQSSSAGPRSVCHGSSRGRRLIYQPDPELRFTGSCRLPDERLLFLEQLKRNLWWRGRLEAFESHRALPYTQSISSSGRPTTADSTTGHALPLGILGASQAASSYPQQLFTIPAGNTAQLLDAILMRQNPGPGATAGGGEPIPAADRAYRQRRAAHSPFTRTRSMCREPP